MKRKTIAIVCFILAALMLLAACAPAYAEVDPNTRVIIPDPGLKKALIETLQMQGAIVDGDRLTAGDLRKIEYMNTNGTDVDAGHISADIRNLSGIEYASNLKSIHIFANNKGDLDLRPLSELKNLTAIFLVQDNISDLKPLSGLNNLKSLELGNNKISDVSPLIGLNNLESLGLLGNKISDISALSGLKSLTELTLDSNDIMDIRPLSGLTNLKRLTLRYNHISDVSPLSGLENLEYLGLVGYEINEIGPLKRLAKLRILHIDKSTYDSNQDTVAILEQRGCEIQTF